MSLRLFIAARLWPAAFIAARLWPAAFIAALFMACGVDCEI